MGLLLRLARRPLALQPLAPTTALYRPTRCAFLQSVCTFTTGPTQDDDVAPAETQKKRELSHATKLELLPATVKAFHARHGHFIMHSGFTVPKQDDSDVHPDLPPYPDAARGLKLGTTLHWLLVRDECRPRRVLEELKAIGFPVGVDWKQYVWERQRLPALRVYQEMYGDLLVPRSFAVPTGDKRWPIETWGFKLGYYAANIRRSHHRTLPREHLQDLDQLNAAWNLKELTHAQRLALLAPTLQVFHAKYGHFLMPFQFVVPEDQDSDMKQADQDGAACDEEWPPKALGEMLGQTLHSFMKSQSQQDDNPDVVQALADIGFPVDVNDWDQYVFERMPLAAFRVYRELHGNCLVPQSFVVPTGDTCWPIETWGLKLGMFANSFRSRGGRSLTQEQFDALAAVGLPLNLNELTFVERLPLLAPTLRAFHARHGHFIMHGRFIVPKEDDSDANPDLPPYPTETRGVNLGNTLRWLLISEQRRHKHSHVLQELEEIGFPVNVVWKDYVFERQRLPALRVYRGLHGDCYVPESFIVPTGDTEWPIETWGFKLGRYVQNVRQRDYRYLTHEHREQLDQLGFCWGRHDKRSEKVFPAAETVEQK